MTSVSTSSESGTVPAVPQVELQQHELNSLPERQPPPLTKKGWLHGRSPRNDPVIIITHREALGQITAHSQSDLGVELGGALLGRAYRYKGQVYVEVQAALPAAAGDHGPIHFTFTADSWTQLQQDRSASYPHLDIVGWFHTHPGLGVFYSGDDVIVHSAAFTLPWHVGLVVDPVGNEAAFFGWAKNNLVPLAGFYELVEPPIGPVVDWQMVPTTVWQESYEERPEQETGLTEAGEWQTAVWQQDASHWGLIMGALGLLLGFFLLVGWVVPLTNQVNRLESVALTLADEALPANTAACPDPRLRILTPLAGGVVPAGSELEIIGTADHPDAYRYRVEVRPMGVDLWTLVDDQRRDNTLGLLAKWDTSTLQPGMYEIRLTAVDRNNIRLVNSELCLLSITLLP